VYFGHFKSSECILGIILALNFLGYFGYFRVSVLFWSF
jgi:hypothetical protein